MDGPAKALGDAVQAVGAAWRAALPAGARACDAPSGDAGAQLRSMSDRGLLAATDATAKLVRAGEALLAQLAGEVARRSPRESGSDGLAKKQGFQNPVELLADATGGGTAGAAKLVAVGRATSERDAGTGQTVPPAHRHVATALREGAVSIDAAAAITGMLDRIEPRVSPDDADRFERLLVRRAAGLPLALLTRAIREVEARLDPDGVQPREDELRDARTLTMREDARSMLRLTAVLDPETAAPIKAAIEAIVTHAIRSRRDAVGTTGGAASSAAGADGATEPATATGAVGAVVSGVSVGPAGCRGGTAHRPDAAADSPGAAAEGPAVVADTRSIPQMQADALGMIARHALGCRRMPDAPAMAVIVRTDLSTLLDGVGHATVDGLDQPLSAGTVRKLAASAGIIPAVMGTESVPLDLGRANRLFTPAQKIALAERDGGCACCGLDISYAEAHHIAWWARDDGPTNLANGIMLCPACHTRVHKDGWRITATRSEVWFTPPRHVDPEQRPRAGGRARFSVTCRAGERDSAAAPARHATAPNGLTAAPAGLADAPGVLAAPTARAEEATAGLADAPAREVAARDVRTRNSQPPGSRMPAPRSSAPPGEEWGTPNPRAPASRAPSRRAPTGEVRASGGRPPGARPPDGAPSHAVPIQREPRRSRVVFRELPQ